MDTVTTLTPLERLTLANQFRMLEKLDLENADEYKKNRDIIVNGYTIQYDEVLTEIDDEMSVEECRYVYDVLNMYRALIRSYEDLKDKKDLTSDNVKFRGFDANEESKQWAFTKHLQEEGMWEETLKGVDVNNHGSISKSRYPKMLKRFEPIWEQLLASHSGNFDLTAEQIKEIIDWKAPGA
jgi:uncharacterized protein YfbU (UPF0304 family)